jgi:hypothetical protein
LKVSGIARSPPARHRDRFRAVVGCAFPFLFLKGAPRTKPSRENWLAASPREEAESYAVLDVVRCYPWALTGVTVVQFENEVGRARRRDGAGR